MGPLGMPHTGKGDTIVIFELLSVQHVVLKHMSIFFGPPQSCSFPLGGAFLETLCHRGQVGEVLSHTGNQRLNHVFILRCTALSLLQRTHTPESHPVGLSTLSECPSGQTGQHCTSPPRSEQQFAIVVAPEFKSEVKITTRQWENVVYDTSLFT